MVDKGVMESGSLKKAGNNTHRRPKGSHKLLVLYPVFTFKECQHLFFTLSILSGGPLSFFPTGHSE